jgi:protein deglycase
MKKACVLLAEGFEEVEAITPMDYLRRAGIEVTVFGVGGLKITGAHGIVMSADATLGRGAAIFDAIVVPGGMPGARNIADSAEAVDLIKRHAASGALVAAICAAPAVVLHRACGLLRGRRFTGYPGTERQVDGGIFVPERVVIDGKLFTSRAAGTAGEFTFAIIAELLGETEAKKIAEGVLHRA